MGIYRTLLVLSRFVALLAIAIETYIIFFVKEPIGIKSRQEVNISGSVIRWERDAATTVTKIYANTSLDFSKALGYVHAKDRSLQMLMYRAISEGKLSERFSSDEMTNGIDRFMRSQQFAANLENATRDSIGADVWDHLKAYSDGFNTYISTGSLPIELTLVGYQPTPWTPQNTLAIGRLIAYLGLGQQQENAEKFIIEALQQKTGLPLVKSLFEPYLDEISGNSEYLEIIRKLNIESTLIPPKADAFLKSMAPGLSGSNNWGVSGKLSKSGNALYASDPHLNIVNLPCIWYEVLGYVKEDGPGSYRFGITLPSLGTIMGRTQNWAAGFTYGFGDQMDFFIEECRNFECRSENGWKPINIRGETILRKGQDPIEVKIYRTERGLLEVNSSKIQLENGLKHGYYLSRKFIHEATNMVPSSRAIFSEMWKTKTAEELSQVLRKIDLTCNFIIVDTEGNLAYQQSGVFPKRSHNGLYPLYAWSNDSAWEGHVDPSQLEFILNPISGVYATNNNFHGVRGKYFVPVNLHMGSYRTDRFDELAVETFNLNSTFQLEDFKRYQADVVSIQARKFVEILRKSGGNFKAGTAAHEMIYNWKFDYSLNSKGARIFEEFYDMLMEEMYGKILGKEAWKFLRKTIFLPYFHYWDNLILNFNLKDEFLWKNRSRDEIFNSILNDAKFQRNIQQVPEYGENRKISMENSFFGGKLGTLGTLLGIDYPISVEGGRATLNQGQLWNNVLDKDESFGVSWRFVTDMGTEVAESVIPSGPSGKIWSGLYTSETEKWLNHQYKLIQLQDST